MFVVFDDNFCIWIKMFMNIYISIWLVFKYKWEFVMYEIMFLWNMKIFVIYKYWFLGINMILEKLKYFLI